MKLQLGIPIKNNIIGLFDIFKHKPDIKINDLITNTSNPLIKLCKM